MDQPSVENNLKEKTEQYIRSLHLKINEEMTNNKELSCQKVKGRLKRGKKTRESILP